MDKKRINDYLNDDNEIDLYIESILELLNIGILTIDYNYKDIRFYVDDRIDTYIEQNELQKNIMKYTIKLLDNLTEIHFQNRKQEDVFDKEFLEINSYLIQILEEKIIDKQKNNYNKFHYTCLNDKFENMNYQIINKTQNGYNVTTGLININILSNDGNERTRFNFEISKKNLKNVINQFEDLLKEF